MLTQSAIGEINLATELQGTIGNARGVPLRRAKGLSFSLKVRLVKYIWQRSCKKPSATLGGSAAKSEGTLVLTQSAIGEINL